MSLVDSPFADRLYTNYAPSDAEISEICALLVDPVGELARVDAQIEEMEIMLSQLKEKRAMLKTPIDAHRALMSPIRRIPRDVLSEIFFSCLPSVHNALIDPAEAPLLLGRICRHWRSVSYSTPSIWSSIHIPSFNYRNIPPIVETMLEGLVEAWLQRSAACSLSVSFSDTVVSYDSDMETHPIISQLLKASLRLRHLALAGDAQLFRPLLRLGPEYLPLLRSIRVQTIASALADGHPDAMKVLQIPTLEDVSLYISEAVDPLSLPLRWSQLTGLSLSCYPEWTAQGRVGGLDAGGIFDVLRRCPNLVQCQLRVSKILDPELTRDRSSITLPHLQSLTLGGQCEALGEYISCLAVPKLRHLQIGHVSSELFSDAPIPDSSLGADIDPDSLTASDFLEVLRHFPMISRLRLSSIPYHYEPMRVDSAFLERFYQARDILCPMLTHFAATAPCVGFSDTAALAFVRARMALPSPLQQFRVYFGRSMEVDIMPDLQSFISDGLQVELMYSSPTWKFDAREGMFDASVPL
ncbi:hypothetical protein B0H19DRAFT_1109349 [Mycena capillaripes]|nr:hypothetical protein B0H19DRAFT_1109349 [Mycena capillaripes]